MYARRHAVDVNSCELELYIDITLLIDHGLGSKSGVGGRLCRPEKRLRKCSKRAIIPVLVQYQPTVP